MSTIQRKGGSHLFNSLHVGKLKLQEDLPQQEKTVIAQPIFVFEKREPAFKRPAEDTLYKAAEHESPLSHKRMRSASFADHPTFPPSGPVNKNNVFMSPTLVQKKVDMNNTKGGPVKHTEHVLRPAILQPPQVQKCGKISEGNSYLLSDNQPSARISVQVSTNQHFLSATSVGCQLNEDKCSFKSYSSDFVFGENMVERVLGTQKLNQPQLENDSYTKEKPFKSTLKLTINSPNTRTDSIKNTSLIESAAAFSSKPTPKCLLEKIDIKTGEEAEYNVLKITCKLFIFNNTTQSWTERGRGTLRLNDTAHSDYGTLQSRLIMRNQGSLRLILNSKLWAQMRIQRANHKNLQITATDLEDYSIRIFLIQANAKDIGYLYAAIHHRLVALRSFIKQKGVNQAENQSEIILQQLNCDSCDEDEDDFIQVPKNGSGCHGFTDTSMFKC
ncbi:ran-binding protein 3-like isoform X2 [Elephas maximus indicus]|uniref:ran-binding protein 3-like isoform X2 n=1 Tax=Elephas maximus indicus TaxID=99487 RepID=UPI002116E0A8|nr:ran-binding protein 3-like isoform X2 [Elephas maximus indicus]